MTSCCRSILCGVLEHRTWKHFRFGVRYHLLDYDVDEKRDLIESRYRLEISGFEIYGRFAF